MSNPVYTGRLGWHKRRDKERKADGFRETEVKTGAYEALWSDELFAQIRAVQSQKATGGRGGGRMVNVYPFRSLVVCDRCGQKMYG